MIDDMWIVNGFDVDHHWLDPSREDVFLWPVTSDSGNCAFFRCSFLTIKKQVEDGIRSGLIPSLNEDCATRNQSIAANIDLSSVDYESSSSSSSSSSSNTSNIAPNGLEHQVPQHSSEGDEETSTTRLGISLKVNVFHGRAGKVFGNVLHTKLIDVDSGYAQIKDDEEITFVATTVCSYRLDEQQHIIFGFQNRKIVWEGWTVEETNIGVTQHDVWRLLTHGMTLRIRKNAFLFSREKTFLSNKELLRLIGELSCVFYSVFPSDIIANIAHLVHERTTSISSSDFQRGVSKRVLNYGIARLLRVGWHRNMTTGVHTFLQMSTSQQETEYHNLKALYRSRGNVFNRRMRSKRLRSGRTY